MNMGVSDAARCGRVFMVYLVSMIILVASFIGCFVGKAYVQGQSLVDNVDCAYVVGANSSSKYAAAKQWLLYETSLDAAQEELAGQNFTALDLPGTPNLLRCYCNNASTGLFAVVDSESESFLDELLLAGEELGIEVDTASINIYLCEALYVDVAGRCHVT